jgi:hypothetical protein
MVAIEDDVVTFHKATDNGLALQEIGRIEFGSGAMTFEGNFEESSLAFFELVAKHFQDSVKQAYQRGYEDCLTDEVKKK